MRSVNQIITYLKLTEIKSRVLFITLQDTLPVQWFLKNIFRFSKTTWGVKTSLLLLHSWQILQNVNCFNASTYKIMTLTLWRVRSIISSYHLRFRTCLLRLRLITSSRLLLRLEAIASRRKSQVDTAAKTSSLLSLSQSTLKKPQSSHFPQS